ncbi:MAG: hypothetical protein JO131_02845 [Gammaproteobacteria bacterium]|nr:hypothetical protein [Gammaproteobacteria bacterium]
MKSIISLESVKSFKLNTKILSPSEGEKGFLNLNNVTVKDLETICGMLNEAFQKAFKSGGNKISIWSWYSNFHTLLLKKNMRLDRRVVKFIVLVCAKTLLVLNIKGFISQQKITVETEGSG